MSPINSLWFKWKGLRLPWRRSFLVGTDLHGNTFWEFKDQLNAGRFRRIVKTDPKTHLADVQVSPQWHQWLRYVRADPPSIQEQQQDIIRQMQIKELARLADERWASKPSYLDMPKSQQQPLPATNTSDATVAQANKSPSEDTQTATAEAAKKNDPWAKATAGAPGQKWQPDSWSPTASKR
ncbi:hypothetical protein BO83DRAFT_358062 [Aspergillus eucalypticola CBS 122712]|uniref:Uncharacterized protein n=1 Tax=Aspergillus eucalypticola (strain CBS 122712 / IBT 29274) TaxID=1448314 RepID=A0A317VSA0_ASPEC|nr:uncharacterized protein BO83DRAFT_358062 [Aspergillus eucalypticola CBS 122712]PWY76755.1 hypothetical protein BO83DRAFT_358062 [Aspergillus eucalypticola CBS 122712]